MRKFIKRFLITSALLVGGLQLVGCDNKEKDNKNGPDVIIDVTSESTESITTTELITTAESTTVTETVNEDTEEITEETVNEDTVDYIVTDTIDTSVIVDNAVEATKENPAVCGEWSQAFDLRSNIIYFRIVEIKSGQEAQDIVSKFKEVNSLFPLNEPKAGEEYKVIKYQVYFPEDYPDGASGIGFTGLGLSGYDNGENKTAISCQEITGLIKPDTIFNGDVLEGYASFTSDPSITDYTITYGSWDSDFNVITKYVECK